MRKMVSGHKLAHGRYLRHGARRSVQHAGGNRGRRSQRQVRDALRSNGVGFASLRSEPDAAHASVPVAPVHGPGVAYHARDDGVTA